MAAVVGHRLTNDEARIEELLKLRLRRQLTSAEVLEYHELSERRVRRRPRGRRRHRQDDLAW